MASGIDFRILGPLEVWLGSRLVEIKGSAQRALLARLLLDANRVVSVEQLIVELWHSPPETGPAALHQRVAKLREALTAADAGEKAIVTRDPGYLIELEMDQLDLHRFEALVARGEQALAADEADLAAAVLREGLELWRGAPLTEFSDAPFATSAAARLEEVRLMVLEKRFEADLTLGRHAQLIPELEEITLEHSYREGFSGQLMTALYRSGRQSEALDVYRQLRSTLVDELGVEPTQTLQDLERAILNHDSSLDLVFPADTDAQTLTSATPERSILVFPSDLSNLEALLRLAEPMTHRPRREIIVTALAPTGDDLAGVADRLERERKALLAKGVTTRAAAFTSASVGADLVRLVGAQEVDLLLTDAPPELLSEGLPPDALETMLGEAPCDVATLIPGDGAAEGGVGDIVVPFGGNTHDWAALEIGAWLAVSQNTTLELIGTEAQPDQDKRDASRLLADVSLAIQRTTGVSAKPRLVAPGKDAIMNASRNAGLLIVGLSDRWADEGLGPARLALARSEGPPTLIVRRGIRPGGITPADGLTRYTWSLAEARTD